MVRILQLGMAWFPEHPGGLERYYYNLLESLGRQGVATRGLVVGSPNVAEMSQGLVVSHSGPGDSLLRRWSRSRSAVRAEIVEFRPDLIASHFALYAVAALGAIRRSGLPHVVHFHGPWALECREEGDRGLSNLCKRLIERRVYHAADLCITLSEAFKRILIEQYGVAESRVRVIPGGVNVERFRPRVSRIEARAQLGWPTDRPILLTVRRLVHRMGLEDLVAAINIVRRSEPDVLLVMAGRGPLVDRLKQQVLDLGLADHVWLPGFLSDAQLPTAMRAADITVVPSKALEGFGLTVVESLAAGTPCLVSPVGGLPEVVRDLDPSLVFTSATPEAIAERIMAALSGKGPLPTEERCAAFAAQLYDWDVVARQVLEVYREVARGNC